MTSAALVVALVGLPACAALVFGLRLWLFERRGEGVVAALTGATFLLTSGCAVVLIATGVASGSVEAAADLGLWFHVGDYHFRWRLVADHLSLPFSLFASVLLGLIGAFSRRYLHREAGYHRFYFLLMLFGAGVQLVVLAGNVDLAFIGWELVGLTSALLIAFFHERQKPVEHGFRAFVTYRICDVGLLGATVWLHHSVGTTELLQQPGQPWSTFVAPASAFDQMAISLFVLWATMGKSAQVPLSGWLPRAMEGPTPSSAIFYGAISIHLGPYLLLRAAPILEGSPVARGAVIGVGALTALHATVIGRVQTDIKSALAYASMTQVGLVFVEIGLGLRYVAVVHVLGHATLRSLQILRSPSLLHDHHHLEQAMGQVLPKTGGHLERLVPESLKLWLYRNALERGYLDALLRDWVVGGFTRVLRRVDALDQRWTAWLAGGAQAVRSHEEGER